MTFRRLLPLSPDHEPLWVRLYVHQIADAWAALSRDAEERQRARLGRGEP